MLNVVNVDDACRLIRNIRESIWGYDIPSPTIPEYIEHHKQMQNLLKECDEVLDEIDLLAFWVDESGVQ